MNIDDIVNGITQGTAVAAGATSAVDSALDLGYSIAALFDKNARQSMYNAKTQAGLTGAQKEANAFNAEQAQISRDFSEMQRQTNYQTAVADMEKAGLNPALMYGSGGNAASSTSSAQASAANVQSRNDGATNAIQKAMLSLQMRSAAADVELKEAEAEGKRIDNSWKDTLNQANVDKIKQDIAKSESDVEVNGSIISKNNAEMAVSVAEALLKNQQFAQNEKIYPLMVQFQQLNNKLVQANISLTNAKQSLTKEQEDLVIEQANQVIAQVEKIKEETGIIAIDRATFEEYSKSNPDAYTAMKICQQAGATGAVVVGGVEAGEGINKAQPIKTFFKNSRIHPRNRK